MNYHLGLNVLVAIIDLALVSSKKLKTPISIPCSKVPSYLGLPDSS